MGNRTFLGADFRAEVQNFLLSTEIIKNMFDSTIDSVQSKSEPYGYHITLAYEPLSKHQFLVCYNNLSADGIIADSGFYIIRYNLGPSQVTEFQVNHTIDSE